MHLLSPAIAIASVCMPVSSYILAKLIVDSGN